MESREWITVDSASRQHSRIKWTELPEKYQVEKDEHVYGLLIADIKTHNETDAVEYLGVPEVVADKLVKAKNNGNYDEMFRELVDSVVENKREVKLGS